MMEPPVRSRGRRTARRLRPAPFSSGLGPIDEIDPSHVPRSRLDRIIEFLLVGVLAFLVPLHGWDVLEERVLMLLAGAAAACLGIKLLIRRDTTLTWTWAYLPLIALTTLLVVRIVPLPVAVVRALAPHRLTAGETGWRTLSATPAAQGKSLRLLFIFCALFSCGANIQSRRILSRLMGAIAATGAVTAAMFIFSLFFGDGTDEVGLLRPAYVVEFFSLCGGAALGLFLVRLYETFGERGARWEGLHRRVWHRSFSIGLLAAAAMAVMATAICCSLEATGIACALLGIAFTFVAGRWGSKLSTSRTILVLIAFIAVAAGVGKIVGRFETGMWNGIGRGAIAHAGAELGTAGVLIGIIGAVVLWEAYLRGLRSSHHRNQMAVLGLGLGWAAVFFRFGSGFGQHVPAIACLTALITGLMVAAGGLGAPTSDVPAQRRLGGKQWLGGLTLVAVIAAVVWSYASIGGT